jgi:hypothetical protein
MGGCTSISPLATRTIQRTSAAHESTLYSRQHRHELSRQLSSWDSFAMKEEPGVFETDILGRCRD